MRKIIIGNNLRLLTIGRDYATLFMANCANFCKGNYRMFSSIAEYWAVVMPVFLTGFVLLRTLKKARDKTAVPVPVPVRVSSQK